MTEDRKSYVYIIFDMDAVPRYVGKGTNKRLQEHFYRAKNPQLKLLIAEHGEALPWIKAQEHLTHREALDYEEAWIAAIGRMSLGQGPLYNLGKGGEGSAVGYTHTEETKAIYKAAQIKRAYKPTPEVRAKIKAARALQVFTAEHRAAMSASRKGKLSVEMRAKIGALAKARVITEKELGKRSKAQQARWDNYTPEQRLRPKQSLAMTGRKHTPEHIEKVRLARTGSKWERPESRELMSRVAKERGASMMHTPEAREKAAAALRGRVKSPEAVAAMAEAQRRRREREREAGIKHTWKLTKPRVKNGPRAPYKHTKKRVYKSALSNTGSD